MARRPFDRPGRPVGLRAIDSPTISDVVVTNGRAVALSITWLTDGPSDGWVEFGDGGKLDQIARADNRTNTRAHQVTLTRLLPEATFRFEVHLGEAVAGPFVVTTRATTLPPLPLTACDQVETADGVLFRGGAEGRIRRQLVEEDLLDAVIGLPPNLFYGTGIPAASSLSTATESATQSYSLMPAASFSRVQARIDCATSILRELRLNSLGEQTWTSRPLLRPVPRS